MNKTPIIALVGKPNVGKSTLFNRIIKERKAIIEDQPGVTRDRIYAKASWLNKEFILIDTGGITLKNSDFSEQIKIQSEFAIEQADIIVFVLDAKNPIDNDDKMIAKFLHKTKKPVICIVNKFDNLKNKNDVYNYMQLSFGEAIPVSSAHGIGIGDLLDQIINKLPKTNNKESEQSFNITIIGKQNVGKSSLVNAILNEERMIVSPIAGTTLDSVDSIFKYNNQEYVLVDTAGLKKKGKLNESLEKYSYLRSINSIEKANLVLFMVDATQKITDHDTNIAGFAFEENKPIIIVVNKWDLIKNKDSKTILKKEEEIKAYFKYLKYAQIIFISAIEKQRVFKIFTLIEQTRKALTKRIRTSVINEVLNRAQLINPPPKHNGGRIKIYYALQVEAQIPTFVLFVNSAKFMHFSYKRFIENQIRQQFNFVGVPINLVIREKKNNE